MLTLKDRIYVKTLFIIPLLLIGVLKSDALSSEENLTEISVAQSHLYFNRIQASKFINVPYSNLKSAQSKLGRIQRLVIVLIEKTITITIIVSNCKRRF